MRVALLRRLMEGGVPKLVLDVNTDGAAVGQIGIVTTNSIRLFLTDFRGFFFKQILTLNSEIRQFGGNMRQKIQKIAIYFYKTSQGFSS